MIDPDDEERLLKIEYNLHEARTLAEVAVTTVNNLIATDVKLIKDAITVCNSVDTAHRSELGIQKSMITSLQSDYKALNKVCLEYDQELDLANKEIGDLTAAVSELQAEMREIRQLAHESRGSHDALSEMVEDVIQAESNLDEAVELIRFIRKMAEPYNGDWATLKTRLDNFLSRFPEEAIPCTE